ncbi:ribosome biogenesis GTP-binding protein YihA/YsxC [Roseimarinus sediminis]|uniref:ribosome biogenesis GTP-binding protein YihA/YsxC n=1 Tax=Roseimarinus sediminis TaxID=1610899 RepID=UPI003D24F591
MIIHDARFVISNTDIDKCPNSTKPEYAFIGRSNVGKSSLINMLTGQKKLAMTSGKPGKTRLINHFIINGQWYLVDLPGYGYAKSSKSDRKKWQQFIRKYLLHRKNLYGIFVLIDARLEPQNNDLEFMQWLGENQIPFVIVFTKVDKLNKTDQDQFEQRYADKLLETWAETPIMFQSSAETGLGREEILDFIEKVNNADQ